IIVFGRSEEEFVENLKKVLNRLIELRLSLNRKKCRIGCDEVEYLGFLINSDGRRIDPERIDMLKDMMAPRCKKDLRRMLGMATYLMSFVPDFSRMLEPISKLLKGEETEIRWETEQAEAWQRLVKTL
ncbi:unnamed protein product, partial [Aduncisulcus paluster]